MRPDRPDLVQTDLCKMMACRCASSLVEQQVHTSSFLQCNHHGQPHTLRPRPWTGADAGKTKKMAGCGMNNDPPAYSPNNLHTLALAAVLRNEIDSRPIDIDDSDDEWARRRAPSIDSLPGEITCSWSPQPAGPQLEDDHDPFIPYIPPPQPEPTSTTTTPVENPKKRPGRPRKVPEATPTPSEPPAAPVTNATSPEPESVPTFSVGILVQQPDTITKLKGGKTKTTKTPPKVYGPAEVPMDAFWDVFIGIIQQELRLSDPRQLRVDSFYWRFPGAQTTPYPLQSPSNLQQLVKQLANQKANQEKLIDLEMKPPLSVMPRRESMPWATEPVSATGSASTGDAVFVVSDPRVDEDEHSDDLDGPMKKKAKLDDNIEDLVRDIETRYGPSDNKPCKAPEHSSIPCFIHPKTGLHFDVGFRPQALQWAGKIRLEQDKPVPAVDITRIPIGEGWFSSTHALKPLKKKNTVTAGSEESSLVTSTSQTPVPVAPTPPTPAAAMNTGAQRNTPATPTPAQHQSTTYDDHSHVRSSSPFIDANTLTLSEFCIQYKFDAKIQKQLESLDFQPGDNLEMVKPEDWSAAGFQQLSWRRVTKANKDYRKSLIK
ncbi:hypothetical protein K435DRAFT_809765 [Dendrothele bispora CBS 962.96]|uniref:Uncharacterized protein n=1 Tax=Dendrothele bispora (strain CBS 962.96) TaxID=1314807 RepID=A0A4S8KX86_DENBC|nr:hypothetical protein K435DRAFT_809765 [Dendrothele bispora CBS 962.96]